MGVHSAVGRGAGRCLAPPAHPSAPLHACVPAGDGSGDASGGEGEELDAATALDLLNLGIVSPVTKETAGSLYLTELARQLADFLKGPVERAGGMMPLPDVYCLYNRARGAELVSPDDLLQAVALFPQVRRPACVLCALLQAACCARAG